MVWLDGSVRLKNRVTLAPRATLSSPAICRLTTPTRAFVRDASHAPSRPQARVHRAHPRLHVRTSHTETPERRHACPRHLRDRPRFGRDHRRRPIQFSWIGSRHRPRGRIQRDVLGPSQGQFPRRGRLRCHHTRCRRVTRGRPRRQGGLRHRPLLLRAGRLGDNSDPRRSRRGSRGDARQRHVHREQRHDPGHRDDNRRR